MNTAQGWRGQGCLVVLVLCLMVFSVGCAIFGRSEENQDDFPQEIARQCVRARADAVKWYQGRYHEVPKVPSVVVYLEDDPPNGMGGWTPTAWVVYIWRDQNPFYGSLTHEFRHTLTLYNGKGNSEEAVQ